MNQQNFKNLIFVYVSLVIVSCSHDSNNVELVDSRRGKYDIIDSTKLFSDSTSFEFLNIDKISEGTILAFQYPILNLSLLNSKGKLIKEINRQGNLKGNFSCQFIDCKWFEEYLYVLEEGNKFGIIIYDKNLNFVKAVNFNKYFLNSFVFPKVTSFEIIRKNKNIEMLLSIANDRYNYYTPDYYLNSSSVAVVKMENMDVKDVKYVLPYKSFDSISNSITVDKRMWNNPNVFFQYSDGMLYLKYNFDDIIYVVDINDYKIIDMIKMNIVYSPKDKEFVSFSKPDNVPRRAIKNMMKLSYVNSELQSFLLKKNKIYALYNIPTNREKIQDSPVGLNKMSIESVVYVIDLKTKKQNHYVFNNSFNFSSLYADDNYVYLTSNQFITENPYLYKIKLL